MTDFRRLAMLFRFLRFSDFPGVPSCAIAGATLFSFSMAFSLSVAPLPRLTAAEPRNLNIFEWVRRVGDKKVTPGVRLSTGEAAY